MSDNHGGSQVPVTLIFIIGILLVGALIGIFYPKTASKVKSIIPRIDKAGYTKADTVNPNDRRETNAYYIKADIDKPVCGIKIFSPLPGQQISFPLEVSGYVNGCNWVPFESQVGKLEIRDTNNTLSQLIVIPVDTDTHTLPAYFKIKIIPQTMPSSQNGVLIFHNIYPAEGSPETFQVPIKF